MSRRECFGKLSGLFNALLQKLRKKIKKTRLRPNRLNTTVTSALRAFGAAEENVRKSQKELQRATEAMLDFWERKNKKPELKARMASRSRGAPCHPPSPVYSVGVKLGEERGSRDHQVLLRSAPPLQAAKGLKMPLGCSRAKRRFQVCTSKRPRIMSARSIWRGSFEGKLSAPPLVATPLPVSLSVCVCVCLFV